MPNKLFHTEDFKNLGGINTKISPYNTGMQQFLDLKNFDFQQPGALSQRWGSTQYVSQGFSLPVNSLYEFVRLDGFSGVVTGVTGALYFGATTGIAQGVSFNKVGATVFIGEIAIQFLSYFVGNVNFLPPGGYFQDITTQPLPANELFPANAYGANKNDYSTFNNQLFMADGNKFLRFSSGTTISRIGLPYVTQGPVDNFTGVLNLTTSSGLGLTGVYNFAMTYVNDLGFEGPITPIAALPLGSINSGTFAANLSGPFFNCDFKITIPNTTYNIAQLNIYSYWQGATFDLLAGTGTSQWPPINQTFWDYPYTFLRSVTLGGMTLGSSGGVTYALISLGITAGQVNNVLTNANPVFLPNTYDIVGGSTYLALGTSFTTGLSTPIIAQPNAFPKYIEIYQNRLALAGFSGIPSSMILSDVDKPEAYPVDLQFEVRTNDGDVVTGLKAYNQRLYVFKHKSFHEFSGDTETNFAVRQISQEYGAISNQAIEVFAQSGSGDVMVFLDSKGLMQFNGAGAVPISDAIQPIFQTMNLTAAADNAVMVHDKQRNQLLLGIPVNGATMNNLTIVYDYLVRAWTTYDGFLPSSFAIIQQRFNLPTMIYGNYSGTVLNFGASFKSDNGIGFTLAAQTRYLHDMGDTVEKQFRRLWFNTSEANNATVNWAVNFYQDYGASIVYQVTMTISQFQNRIDFGIPAKSLSLEFFKYDPDTYVRLYGYGTAHRFQRDV